MIDCQKGVDNQTTWHPKSKNSTFPDSSAHSVTMADTHLVHCFPANAILNYLRSGGHVCYLQTLEGFIQVWCRSSRQVWYSTKLCILGVADRSKKHVALFSSNRVPRYVTLEMLWEKVIVEESGWCWWWLVPAAEPRGSTVTLEWALRRTVPATAVSDLSMHNCVPMQCKSHCADAHCIAHWTINIAVSMWRWWSTEAASCCTFPRRLKRATQSDRAALLSFPLLTCSQLNVRACTYLAQIESAHCTNSCVYCACHFVNIRLLSHFL